MQEFLVRNKIKDKVLAVGVSGGADSLALALMAKEQLSVYGYKIVALTVNHGLRAGAAKEAEYVAQVMRRYGIEHHILEWIGDKPKTGVEEAARVARYSLMKRWCNEHQINVLLVAHHLRDQAETFLMRLQRGSGLSGLCSMREVSDFEGLKIARPLLGINPQVLKDYLQAKNIVWVEDESNSDTAYLRNKIRKFLPDFCLSSGISMERIEEAVINLQSADDFIEGQVAALFGETIKQYGKKVFCFAHTDYLKWHREIKFRVLAKLCKRQYIPRADSVLQLAKTLDKLPFSGGTLGGKEIFLYGGLVWIIPELSAKHKATRKDWEDFILINTQYKNIKFPHKAKLAILSEREKK